jgi:hypothetical protein
LSKEVLLKFFSFFMQVRGKMPLFKEKRWRRKLKIPEKERNKTKRQVL